MKYSTVEDVLASFPHPILPSVEGEPDYQTIHATRKSLANSRAIDTHLRGGTLGHLGLPRCHRCNVAERSIRTFKEHFVAGLYSVDPSFPMHLWDRLLPQAEITLNLPRTSRLHPNSAAAHYHGLVDYNKTAFSPPGCKIITHEKPGKRRTWAPHGQHGYSLGHAMHHYRCQNVYISTTASERIVDTLEFFPHNYQMPQL
jgi:hypothetical protein